MPSSIARLTALDHDRLVRLLRRASAPGPSQERWRDEAVHLIRAHLDAERTALTAEVLATVGTTAAGTDISGVDTELAQATEALANRSVDDPRLPQDAAHVSRLVTSHAAALGERVLVPLEQAVARKELRRLGGVYADCRDQALLDQGEAEPPPRRLDLSRAELYELAKKVGIEGRSTMSRRDLIAELQRRQRTT